VVDIDKKIINEVELINNKADDEFSDYAEYRILVDKPKIWNKRTKSYFKPRKDVDWLSVSVYFETRGESYDDKVFNAKSTLKRLALFKKATVMEVVTEGRTAGNKLVLNKCHFSWWCGGKPSVIENSPAEIKAWDDSKKAARVALDALKRGELANWKWDHYCELTVERRTSWVPYMKKSSRVVRGGLAYYSHDKTGNTLAWAKHLKTASR
jgi:spore germination cell wall hydrolase CwlJ-like protein